MQQDKGASANADRDASLTASAVPASQSGIPSAFTPGPWEWAYFGSDYGYCLVGASPSHSSVRQNVTIAHDTADGKLAAAAPELLAAAQLAARDMDWSSGKGRAAWDALNAAIAEATGGAA